jgi:WD40 repeat protein
VPVLTSADGGKQIISWSSGSLLEVYDVATAKQVNAQTAHTTPTSALVFSADGSIAALGGKDGSIRLWDTTKKAAVPGSDFPAHQEKIVDLLLIADKAALKTLITTDAKGNVSVWDLATLVPVKGGVQPKPVKTWQAHQESIVAFAISPDGKYIATAGQDNVVKVWETQTGTEARKWDFHLPKMANHSFIRNLAFTPDSKQLATANADTTAYLLQMP